MTPQQLHGIALVRKRIDEIDNTVLDLLKERLDCARTIGKLKDESKRAKWDPQRELEIYERLRKNNADVFPPAALYSIFHEIITTCRLSQRKATVAYLGPEATFTHQAGVRYFGQTASYQPMESIPEVFQEVERERVQYGIIPVENSIEGAVTYSLDSFLLYKVQICGEIKLPINHNLVNRSGNMEDIKTVVSHSQAPGPVPPVAAKTSAGCAGHASLLHRHRSQNGCRRSESGRHCQQPCHNHLPVAGRGAGY